MNLAALTLQWWSLALFPAPLPWCSRTAAWSLPCWTACPVAQNTLRGHKMSQKQVDLTDRTVVGRGGGGCGETGRDGTGHRDKPSVLEESSYTRMTSAAAPEGMSSDGSGPNVGFWNTAHVLLWSAASKKTCANTTAVTCRLHGHSRPHALTCSCSWIPKCVNQW